MVGQGITKLSDGFAFGSGKPAHIRQESPRNSRLTPRIDVRGSLSDTVPVTIYTNGFWSVQASVAPFSIPLSHKQTLIGIPAGPQPHWCHSESSAPRGPECDPPTPLVLTSAPGALNLHM